MAPLIRWLRGAIMIVFTGGRAQMPSRKPRFLDENV
jgi:hypothetical protein